ncbi:MAG: UbiA family prenyltransferase [Candidatus Thermoplasmatota archaeon]|nr:UbiA family prenyltransferase [Candidatus Thermoplasmatota archaeon]
MCAKLFMKDPLDKVEYAPKRLRAFVDLVRPFTLLAPVLGGFSGALLGLITSGDLHSFDIAPAPPFLIWHSFPFFQVLSGIASLVFLNAASNSLNQVYDHEIDRINKPYRPIPLGIITEKEGLWIAGLLYVLSIWRAAMVNRTFLLMVCVLILITIGYSVPPLRFKKRVWLSNISIALPRGMLGLVAAWTITADIGSPTPWIMGSVMAIFLTGSITTKDITDIEGDREFGMRTLPVVYGKKKAIILSTPFLVAPFLLMVLYWYLGLLPGSSIVMAAVFFVWSMYLIILLIRSGDREDLHFENSPAWKQNYLMLLGLQMGFLVIFLV